MFGAVGGPAFVTDIDRGRRAGNVADFVDYVRVIGALDIVHQEGGGPLEPTDLPVATRHLDMYPAFATLLDKTWQCLGFGAAVVDDALEIASASPAGSTATRSTREPSLMTIINTNTPLRLDGPMSDGLIEMAKHGQPVVATPFTLAGAMSPATLAGALAQQNAEALFMVALAQIARPGAPMVYGGFTSNVDMRTGSPAFGTPEYVKAAFATGQLARRYGLPWRSSNATASNVVDAQAAYEIGDGDLGRDHGRRQPAVPGRRLARGRADGVVREADPRRRAAPDDGRGPRPVPGRRGRDRARRDRRGRARAATSSRRPTRSSATRPRSTGRSCPTGGTSRPGRRTARETATERANRIWKQLLAEYEPPPLDPAAAEALDDYVERRRREIEASL